MNHRRALWLPTCVYVLGISVVFIPRVAADRVNVTVDDSSSDIVYAPLSAWNVENDCNGCTAHPDPSLTRGGTWHDTSFPPNGTAQDLRTASLEFTGSALYVFCIISQSIDHPFGTSDMTFSIDGNVVGRYTSVPSGDKTYDYNVPVYANDSVGSGSHSFTVTNGTPGGPETLLLLDYIIYSKDIDPPPTSPTIVTSPPPVSAPPVPPSTNPPTQVSSTPISNEPSISSTALKSPIPGTSSSTASAQSFLLSSSPSVFTTTLSSGPTVTTVLSSNASPSVSGSSANSELPPSSTSHTRTTIIAATVAGCVVLILVLLGLLLCRRRSLRNSSRNTPPTEPIETIVSTSQQPNSYVGLSTGYRDAPPVLHGGSHSEVGTNPFSDEGERTLEGRDSERSPFADSSTNLFSSAYSDGVLEPITSHSGDGTRTTNTLSNNIAASASAYSDGVSEPITSYSGDGTQTSNTLSNNIAVSTFTTSQTSHSRIPLKGPTATSPTYGYTRSTPRGPRHMSSLLSPAPTLASSSVIGEDPPPAYQA